MSVRFDTHASSARLASDAKNAMNMGFYGAANLRVLHWVRRGWPSVQVTARISSGFVPLTVRGGPHTLE